MEGGEKLGGFLLGCGVFGGDWDCVLGEIAEGLG